MKYEVWYRSSRVWEWTLWGTCAGNNEQGTCYDRNGIILLRRYEKSAVAWFMAKGKMHRFNIKPCPTRPGLVRMAKRWLREVVKDGEPHL